MNKYNAKSVVADSFWIVEERGSRIGTIRKNVDIYTFYNTYEKTEKIVDINDFNITTITTKVSADNQSVLGYPTNQDMVYNGQLLDNVPAYTKTPKSNVYFVAGYWGLLFSTGWRPSFCPRHKTQQGYTSLGPFKNEADMYLAIKRQGADYENITSTNTNSVTDY